MKYPHTPKEWQDGNLVLYRTFELDNVPDIQYLLRLVQENVSNKGNDQFLRARLTGILLSYLDKTNSKFWEKHYHPKTWRVRYLMKIVIKKYRRFFKTKKFKKEVELFNIATGIL